MRIIWSTAVPPDGWRYLQKNTGYRMTSMSLDDLMRQIKAHRLANGIPLEKDWQLKVEEEMCRTLPPHYCGEPPPKPEVPRQLHVRDLLRFLRAARSWLFGGGKLVDAEMAQERMAICANCPENVRAEGCHGCEGVLRWLKELLPEERRTTVAGNLQSCRICGCSIALKTQLPLESSPSQDLSFPNHCWITQETQARET